jgi:hypothetical protein
MVAFSAPPDSNVVKDSGFAVTLKEPQSFATVVKLTFAGAKVNWASARLYVPTRFTESGLKVMPVPDRFTVTTRVVRFVSVSGFTRVGPKVPKRT